MRGTCSWDILHALADAQDEFSFLVIEKGKVSWLVWAKKEPMISRDIVASLDGMSF